ncbi:MAG: glycosyltransferase 87 family protein [Acidimicrobiales bacterium]
MALAAGVVHPSVPLDLGVYMAGARAVVDGTSLYRAAFGASSPLGLPFTYPPLAALLMVPLLWLPAKASALLWAASSVAVLVTCVGVASRRGASGPSWPLVAGMAAIALLTYPVQSNLGLGQVDILLMGACMLGCSDPGAHPGRAASVGLAAAVKVVPAIFVVCLLLARKWRAAVVAMGTWAVLTWLAFLVRPASSARYFGMLLWRPSRPGNPASYLNQSLWGLLDRIDLGVWHTPLLVTAIAVVVTVGLWRASRLLEGGNPTAATVLAGLVGVAVSPISWVHETVWLVLAAAIMLARAGAGARWQLAGVGLAVALLGRFPLLGDALVVPGMSRLPSELAIDSYGLLALAVVLAGLPLRQCLAEPSR